MASVLPAALDHLILLLEGRVSGLARAIPAGRFKHTPFDVESLLAASVSAPYPFEIDDLGESQPQDVPSTLSGNQIWHGVSWVVRIAYAASPLDQATRSKTIFTDRYQIRRTLGYPLSWSGVSGVARVMAEEGALTTVEIIGARGGTKLTL